MAPGQPRQPQRARRSVVVAALISIGLWGIAVWVGSSIKYATVFAAILIGSLLVLGALGGILLHSIRRLSRFQIIRRSAVLRHRISNLYRPGAHAAAILEPQYRCHGHVEHLLPAEFAFGRSTPHGATRYSQFVSDQYHRS